MKAYVIATGVIFGLLTVVHFWRMVVEPHLAKDPWFIGVTAASATLCVVALFLVRRRAPR